jgi:hypothetical protein
MSIVVAGVRRSPGASTTALGLAATIGTRSGPGSRSGSGLVPVVVECDPAGGDAAVRFGLALRPGLVEVAAAARHGRLPARALARYAQPVGIGDERVDVVVAAPGGWQTRAVLPGLAAAGLAGLRTPTAATAGAPGGPGGPGAGDPAGGVGPVLLDVGRLDPESEAWLLLPGAEVVLLLVRGLPADVAHLAVLLPQIRQATDRVAVVLAPGGGYGAVDVAQALGGHVDVRGPLPADDRGAAVLTGQAAAGRRWRRLPLVRALTRLSADLSAGRTADLAGAPGAEPSAAGASAGPADVPAPAAWPAQPAAHTEPPAVFRPPQPPRPPRVSRAVLLGRAASAAGVPAAARPLAVFSPPSAGSAGSGRGAGVSR